MLVALVPRSPPGKTQNLSLSLSVKTRYRRLYAARYYRSSSGQLITWSTFLVDFEVDRCW